jgi:hypothetical protein
MDAMDDPSGLGRMLVALGIVIALVGVLLAVGSPVGRLPGDIAVHGDRWSFYLPLGTSILISLVLTLVLTLVGVLGRR